MYLTVPEHLVQFIGRHPAAIISEGETVVTCFLAYINPDLFGRYTRIGGVVYGMKETNTFSLDVCNSWAVYLGHILCYFFGCLSKVSLLSCVQCHFTSYISSFTLMNHNCVCLLQNKRKGNYPLQVVIL